MNSLIKKNAYGIEKKNPNQNKFEGIYRSRWEDTIVVGVGTNLIAFRADTNSPLKTGTLLKSKAKNKFLMETKSNFDYQGEFATFLLGKNTKKATSVLLGATPSKRLEKSLF